jgi:hypothetical protein
MEVQMIAQTQRALIVISQLTQGIPENQQWLYRFIEAAGRSVIEITLKNDYAPGQYRALLDEMATTNNLVDTLTELGAMDGIQAIDLFVLLHGSPDRLEFHNGSWYTPNMATTLAGLGLSPKLRLVYSTACYGATHNDDFIKGGFKAAIGARGVNTNSAFELPMLINLWALGKSVKDALQLGDKPATRRLADEAARTYGRLGKLWWVKEVDSQKLLSGNAMLTIEAI